MNIVLQALLQVIVLRLETCPLKDMGHPRDLNAWRPSKEEATKGLYCSWSDFVSASSISEVGSISAGDSPADAQLS